MKLHPQKARVNKVRNIYQGSLFSFAVEDVTLPNDSRAEMALVRHPGSTAVVPLLDGHMVVMELQYRHAVGEYLLEIPAGTMEPGELPLVCAKRELEEETGFAATEMIDIGKVHIIPAYSDEVIHLYIAKGLVPATQNLDKDEIIEVVEYPLEETLSMIDKGLISDALTILALQRTWFYLRKKN